MITTHSYNGYTYYFNDETGEYTSPFLLKPEHSLEDLKAALNLYYQYSLYY